MFKKIYGLTKQRAVFAKLPAATPRVWREIYYKTYPRFPQRDLPPPTALEMPFSRAVLSRKSVRRAAASRHSGFSAQDLSNILFFGCGINRLPEKTFPYPRRAYPSAGARYPLEVYLFVDRPSGPIPAGSYHYRPQHHSLEELPLDLDKDRLSKEVFGGVNGELVANSRIIVFIAAVYQRTEIKYGNLAFRYICFEAGHLMQNISLAAAAINKGCCMIGSFDDAKVNRIFGLDEKKEAMLYSCGLMA